MVAVLAALLGAGLAVGVVHFTGTPGDGAAAGRSGATAPRSAPAASVPVPAAPSLLAVPPSDAGVPDRAALAERLSPRLAAGALGAHDSGIVADAASGETLFAQRADAPVLPASTAKLATAIAALSALGPAATLTTRVVQGADPASVVLVGGGDPTLASVPVSGYPGAASLPDLVARTASALSARGVSRVTVGYDASMYAGPATAPGWKPSYVTSGNVAPVSALEVDEGRVAAGERARVADPAAAAAGLFAEELAAHGIAITGAPRPAPAPAGAAPIATVHSPPLAALVERMLMTSDNDLAEAMARQVALARGLPTSFAGGARAVGDVVTGLGVTGVSLVDGSGLSRTDRVTVAALATLLRLATDGDPRLRAVATGLPVAGFDGTLGDRFGRAGTRLAAGDVRAKTGTLDHVSALAGLTVDADGRLLLFAFVTNAVPGVDPTAAERALDAVAAALTACGCR